MSIEARLRAIARSAWLGAVASLLIALPADGASLVRIGTSDDYPPFSAGRRGFDVEVAEAMAHDLGWRIEWVRFRWPELGTKVAGGAFDVAMSGITWRPERAVVGWMTRAVAEGGPCVAGEPTRGLVAVNRGGVLERWARQRFARESLVAIDDNLSLPMLLEGGAVSAIVTDSFEIASRPRRPGTTVQCTPPRDHKVYWIAPGRAAELGPRLDAWIRANERRLQTLRRRWFGDLAPRDDVDDVIDLVDRRLALMPLVAAWKRMHGRAIDDSGREQAVLARAAEQARSAGLDVASVRNFFAVQIELAKAVERRTRENEASVDLDRELRPALSQIGDRLVASLAVAAPIASSSLGDDRLAPLGELLNEGEVARLRAALVGVETIKR